MAVFKCKICGGTLEVLENESVFECQYCGSIQTLPKLTNDKINNLYDRANHFRRNNEFDKALALYEKILLEDTTDAEVYWSIVLCKYGIEYVEDPQTKKRVPTIHRAQYTSVLADTDYKLALQYADEKQKRIYEQEASYIDEVQKGILEISLKEEPFDVFICYKESDENGNRTPDSALASELYYELTEMGFKVFFSRITLEDKLGIAYEPYIFAALNSSKVMVVIGTKPEYLNAVWVKNEWSRYLSLIKNGEKKLLIPAYKGMDPYDLPEEFSHLQAQDMNRLGFMFDLLHVIKKVVNTQKQEVIETKPVEQIEEVKVEPKKVETTDYDLPVNVDALLERAFMFLEDQEWSDAEEYCDRVLDYQPKNAMAYVGKLLADLGVEKLEWLKDYKEMFDDNRNYQRAIQFADPTLRRKLEGSLQAIIDRKKESKYSKIYKKAVEKMDDADSRDELGEALKMFREIRGYKNTDVYIKQLEEEIEDMKYSSMYENAKRYQSYNSSEELKKAIDLFEELKNYKDSKKKLEECKTRYEKVKEEEKKFKHEQEIIEKLRKQRNERILKIGLMVAIVIIPIIIYCSSVMIPNRKYTKAIECLNSNNYDMAIHIFEELEDYKDASNQLLEAKYQKGIFMLESKEYDEAIDLFTKVANYKDSEIKLKNAKYEKALILVEEGSHFTAINLFAELGDYKDAKEKVNSIRYEKALIFIKEGKYAEGYSLLQQAGMQEYVEQHIYGRAKIALDNKDYVKAYDLLKLANGYEDSEDLLVQIEPEYYANQLLEKMKKSGLYIAENYLSSIPKNNRNDECLYKLANEFYKNEKHKAYIIYEYLGDYKDSKKYAHNCSYHYEFSKKEIGAKIKFGTYEQDNNSKTKESLEWKICDIDDNRYLLVSSYCIDYKQFHNKFQDVTWEESDLRKWLNHSFYDQAFSKEEKDLVALSEIKTDMYRYSSEDLITQDKVFMLSHTELLEYTNGTKSIDVTTYAQAIYKNIESTNGNSVTENISNYQGYWVREPDIVNNSKWSYIELNHVLAQGKPVNEYYYVRPAIWVEVK